MTTMFSNTFNDSNQLFAFLRSNEGGRLIVRDEEDPAYAVIHYDKAVSDMSNPITHLCRSVIWNKITNTLVLQAPARGLKFGQAPSEQTWVCEEFVDGVMINMFFDPVTMDWRLATRTQLDATGSFYGKRSFATLFWETFDAQGLTKEMLMPGLNYSWVLQHPEERIVVAPAYGIATLTLIEPSVVPPALQRFLPTRYDLKTLEEVKEFVVAKGSTQFQGVVLKIAGNRYKLRSNEYDEARHLRGNQAKRPFIWLERWSQNRLGAYLRLYPEEQCDADAVIANFKTCTQELHALYMKVYRNKELPLGQAPQKYRKLLWDAHQAGKGAYFPHLRQFMNEQDTARKLWLVNYSTRYATV